MEPYNAVLSMHLLLEVVTAMEIIEVIADVLLRLAAVPLYAAGAAVQPRRCWRSGLPGVAGAAVGGRRRRAQPVLPVAASAAACSQCCCSQLSLPSAAVLPGAAVRGRASEGSRGCRAWPELLLVALAAVRSQCCR